MAARLAAENSSSCVDPWHAWGGRTVAAAANQSADLNEGVSPAWSVGVMRLGGLGSAAHFLGPPAKVAVQARPRVRQQSLSARQP